MQAKIARTFRKRPLGIVRKVIPLPDGLQFRFGEIVAAVVGRGHGLDVPGLGLNPCLRCAGEVARQAEIGPAVHPRHWRKRSEAAGTVVVLHGEAPPFALYGVDDASLVQGQASVLARIRRRNLERRRLPPQPVALADSQAFSFADGLHFPWARETIGPRALHGNVAAGNSADDIVLAVELVEMRPLAHAEFRANEDAIRSGNQPSQLRIQLDDAYGPGCVDRVDL